MEYTVLDQRVRPSSGDGSLDAGEVVDYVNEQVDSIRANSPGIADDRLAVLVALKIAAEKLNLQKEYQDNLSKIQSTAIDALHLVEEVSPTAF